MNSSKHQKDESKWNFVLIENDMKEQGSRQSTKERNRKSIHPSRWIEGHLIEIAILDLFRLRIYFWGLEILTLKCVLVQMALCKFRV